MSLQIDLSLSVADSCVLQETWVTILCVKVISQKFPRSALLRLTCKSKG